MIDIIRVGILQMRSASMSGDLANCAAIADHIHNLPQLLEVFRPELLQFYWDVERVQFSEEVEDDVLAVYRPVWDRLRPHVEQMSAARSS